MKVLSPYGKNVTTELNDFYKLVSVEGLLERVQDFLARSYGFAAVQIEEVHVAFGIAVRFSYANESHYLKFTGRANHRDPEGLFSSTSENEAFPCLKSSKLFKARGLKTSLQILPTT